MAVLLHGKIHFHKCCPSLLLKAGTHYYISFQGPVSLGLKNKCQEARAICLCLLLVLFQAPQQIQSTVVGFPWLQSFDFRKEKITYFLFLPFSFRHLTSHIGKAKPRLMFTFQIFTQILKRLGINLFAVVSANTQLFHQRFMQLKKELQEREDTCLSYPVCKSLRCVDQNPKFFLAKMKYNYFWIQRPRVRYELFFSSGLHGKSTVSNSISIAN